MVHRRQVGNETLIFGVQGALWGNAMTWWDHSTGSIWSQPLGEAIAGPRKGQTVELLSSQFTTWAAWVDAHPDTLALAVDAGPSRFDLGDFYLVVDFTEEVRAYHDPIAEKVGPVISYTFDLRGFDALDVMTRAALRPLQRRLRGLSPGDVD